MSNRHTFHARIEEAGSGGAFVRIPAEVEAAFGKKRVLVNAWIDGELYRGTLVRMGTPSQILIILKEIREKIGKGAGDEVEIIVEEDTKPRVVEIPEDLQQAFMENPAAKQAFEKLSNTHRKEHVKSILGAKRMETRRARIQKTIDILLEKKST